MIRLIGRHEWAPRCYIPQRHISPRSRTVTSLVVLVSFADTTACGSQKLASPHLQTAWRRSYATTKPAAPSPEASLPETPGPQELPPPVPHSRSRKVDLRPAPTKKLSTATDAESSHTTPASSSLSSVSASSVPAPPSRPSSTHASSSSTSTSASTTSSPRAEAERIFADAQADIRASESAGILKPPPPDASKIGVLWHKAKQLFKFYYGGIKMQWTHHKMVRDIKARVKAERAEGIERGMTRWETQFVRTHEKDLVKLVPFILILIILEEALPLVVIYAPFMLPSTTVLPSQAERIYAKREEKKAQALGTAKWYAQYEKLDTATLQTLGVKDLSNDLAWTVCRAFDISDRGPRSLVNRRLARHLEYLAQDDALLRREAGTLLTLNELRNALGERGQFTQSMSHDELRQRLDKWLNTVNGERDILGSFLHYAMIMDRSADASKETN